MAYQVRPGTSVRYRTAGGRVHHAIVTAVTSQTVIDLRVGNGATKLAVAAVTKLTAKTPAGAGWFRHVKGLT